MDAVDAVDAVQKPRLRRRAARTAEDGLPKTRPRGRRKVPKVHRGDTASRDNGIT